MKKTGNTIYTLLILFVAGVFLFCAWKLWTYYAESHQTQGSYDELSGLIEQARPTEGPETPAIDWSAYEDMDNQQLATMPESPYVCVTEPETGKVTVMLPEFESLYLLNPDLVGWLSIDGTRINYPVVQRISETDYYLRRDFYGQDAIRGCLYVREQCDVFAPSDNVVIYGHRMQDGTMFADLLKYKKQSFWQEHPYVRFDTLRARHTYQIVCVFIYSSSSSGDFPYHTFNDAADQEEFDLFWQNCRKHALYDTGISVSYGDKLLTLSTCEYSQTNGRLVVVAKRIS